MKIFNFLFFNNRLVNISSCIILQILITLSSTACSSSEEDDDDLTTTPPISHETPSQEEDFLEIKYIQPSSGSAAVPTNSDITVAFNSKIYSANNITASIKDENGDVVVLSDISLGVDSESVIFNNISLSDNHVYTFEISLAKDDLQDPPPANWPLSAKSVFSTFIPCGVTFDIANELTIKTLGSGDFVADSLNLVLKEVTLEKIAMLYENISNDMAFPIEDFYIAIGVAYLDLDNHYSPPTNIGLPAAMQGCAISYDGQFFCESPYFSLSFDLNGETIPLNIDNAEISSQMIESGDISNIDDFSISGFITSSNLEIFFTGLGLTEDFIARVNLDLDTDNDGVNDSATVELKSNPQEMILSDCAM